MMIIFLLIVTAGLLAVFFLVSKEVRRGKACRKAGASQLSEVSVGLPAASDKEMTTEGKYARMQTLLFEKNRTIEQLQKELEREKSNRGSFETLRRILQDEIDSLKKQNRKLKSDIESQARCAQFAPALQPSFQGTDSRPQTVDAGCGIREMDLRNDVSLRDIFKQQETDHEVRDKQEVA